MYGVNYCLATGGPSVSFFTGFFIGMHVATHRYQEWLPAELKTICPKTAIFMRVWKIKVDPTNWTQVNHIREEI